MAPTMILGATGSGKTSALMRRYYEWVRAGAARTDQVLVLTAGAAQSSFWRKNIKLENHGPIEAHSFFGFIQRELNLFWAPVQAAVPALEHWVRPEFLNVEIAHHRMRSLVEPLEVEFSQLVKASPQRIAIQIASNLSTVASAAGLAPGEMARRLAMANREDRTQLFDLVHGLLDNFRESLLSAGILDYGLSLHLFTGVLMHHEPYLHNLRTRYRYLLVDDLDESVPAEQDFLAAVAAQMEDVAYAFGTDGGHSTFMGADNHLAFERFRPGATLVELPGSFTCTNEAFDFGEALALRIRGVKPERRYAGIVEERISTDLRGDMIDQVVQKVAALVRDRGIPAGEIAIISPHVDKALEVTAHRVLNALGIPVQNLSLSRRLVDEPYARAIITLAGLVQPHWGILSADPLQATFLPNEALSPGPAAWIAQAMQLLLGLDPVRASILGDAIWRNNGRLPDLDATGLRRRIGFERSEAYEFLRRWVEEARARDRDWGTDEFCQAAVAEILAPLVGDLTPAKLHACQQLLASAHRFRLAAERFGDGAYGREYIKMLTEGTVAAEPLEAYDPQKDAVTLATPFAYLTTRLTSQYQIWFDLSGDGWYPNDVKELANPHVLSRRWEEGDRWTDNRANKIRQNNAARTARALVRRCRGRLILAECGLNAWGMEQDGGLSEAFSDLIRDQRGGGAL